MSLHSPVIHIIAIQPLQICWSGAFEISLKWVMDPWDAVNGYSHRRKFVKNLSILMIASGIALALSQFSTASKAPWLQWWRPLLRSLYQGWFWRLLLKQTTFAFIGRFQAHADLNEIARTSSMHPLNPNESSNHATGCPSWQHMISNRFGCWPRQSPTCTVPHNVQWILSKTLNYLAASINHSQPLWFYIAQSLLACFIWL